MTDAEESEIIAIRNDLQILKDKMDRMENLMESMIEIYTGIFCEVKDEYVNELKRIKLDNDLIEFSDFNDLRRSFGER